MQSSGLETKRNGRRAKRATITTKGREEQAWWGKGLCEVGRSEDLTHCRMLVLEKTPLNWD